MNQPLRTFYIRRNLLNWVIAAGVVWLVAWSFIGMQFDFTHFGSGLIAARDFVGKMFPHKTASWRYDLNLLRDLWRPLLDTIQMAVVGTVVGAITAFPVSFIAARTGNVPRPISAAVKSCLNVLRAVPTIVYALIVVFSIGLGKSAGALSLAFVSFIALAKLYAEALESISQGPVDAVRASGGNRAQVFVYAMLPQVFPHYLATTLLTFEYNFKDSFVVGIVGAGGLGGTLWDDFNQFKFLDAGVIVAMLIILVNLVDYASYKLRQVFT
jgi:phosphonate transport system permease protein